ncbi:hypothetical protein STEG23_009287, partial [Scotinomys teguina]
IELSSSDWNEPSQTMSLQELLKVRALEDAPSPPSAVTTVKCLHDSMVSALDAINQKLEKKFLKELMGLIRVTVILKQRSDMEVHYGFFPIDCIIMNGKIKSLNYEFLFVVESDEIIDY